MVCQGQDIGSVHGGGVVNGTAQTFSTNSNYESFSCRVPKDDAERATVEKYLASAKDTYKKDEDARSTNMWSWIGGIAAACLIAVVVPWDKFKEHQTDAR